MKVPTFLTAKVIYYFLIEEAQLILLQSTEIDIQSKRKYRLIDQ